MISFEEQIKSFKDKQKQQQCMMGLCGVLVNTANVFDEMKNYILVFTLLQRCFVICIDTHVQSANTRASQLHTPTYFTHRHTRLHTNTHTDHLTGGALACCVCWHVFKVCVTVCLPVPVSVSLVFHMPVSSLAVTRQGLGSSSEYCGHPGSPLRPVQGMSRPPLSARCTAN